jgi:hypothetical protein
MFSSFLIMGFFVSPLVPLCYEFPLVFLSCVWCDRRYYCGGFHWFSWFLTKTTTIMITLSKSYLIAGWHDKDVEIQIAGGEGVVSTFIAILCQLVHALHHIGLTLKKSNVHINVHSVTTN